MFFRRTRIALAMVAAPAAVLAMGLSAGVANAASTPCPAADGCIHYSTSDAGFANKFTGDTIYFNDVRTNAQNLPAIGTSAVGTVAIGVVLQQDVNSTSDVTYGLGLVDGTTLTGKTCDNGGNPANQWILEEGSDFKELSGTPVPPTELTPIYADQPTDTVLTCVAPGTPNYYLEIHNSTLLNTISFDAGYIEPGDPLVQVDCPFSHFRFHEAGFGMDTTNGADAATIPLGTMFHFNRTGLTTLLQPDLAAGATDSRITFDKYNIQEFIGTQTGAQPSVGNGVTLSPSVPLGVGSSDTITVG